MNIIPTAPASVERMKWTPPATESGIDVPRLHEQKLPIPVGGVRMNHTLIAVDLAKTVFQIAVAKRTSKAVEDHRLSRTKFLRFFAKRQPATVVMEACGSSHHWARELQKLGHDVVLLPPQYVAPYVHRDKTDRADAHALLEAVRDPRIQPVPVKSINQQTLTALHRLRSAWLAARTARINTVRGILRELGLIIPVGATHVVPRALELIEDADVALPDPLRLALAEACLEIRDFEQRIQTVDKQLQLLAREDPIVKRLRTIPGIGLLTATALVAFVGDSARFPSGRHFASYLGLAPRERSSGLKRRIGAISKRGDTYLRMLLVHGARSVLWAAKRNDQPDRLRAWALRTQRLRGHNKAAVALANKIARIAWAVWKNDTVYRQASAEA
jgi:transposase